LENLQDNSNQAVPMTIATSEDRATRVRWKILSLIAFTLAVTALNRLNLSIAGKSIEEEFSFDTIAMGGATPCFRFPGEISATALALGAH
jgi:sugar phosphate permease